jgi:hypothetical protein
VSTPYGGCVKTILGLVLALSVAVTLSACSAGESSSTFTAADVEGTWTGDNLGYENGVYQDREIRLVIEQSTDNTFAGVKSWREHGGQWSEPESFAGSVSNSKDFYAADSDGYIVGTVDSSSSINATYLEAGDDGGVFALTLTKSAP